MLNTFLYLTMLVVHAGRTENILLKSCPCYGSFKRAQRLSEREEWAMVNLWLHFFPCCCCCCHLIKWQSSDYQSLLRSSVWKIMQSC